jgi:hypothetical protein
MVPTKFLLCSGVAAIALLVSYPAFADDVTTQIQLLRQQIQLQQKQIPF